MRIALKNCIYTIYIHNTKRIVKASNTTATQNAFDGRKIKNKMEKKELNKIYKKNMDEMKLQSWKKGVWGG